MKIVLLEPLGIPEESLNQYAEKLEGAGHEFRAYPRDTDPAVQTARAEDADVIMLANMPLSGEVIRSCKKLKYIDIAFTGVDHVEISAAKEKGIAVSNAAGYSTQAVAELTLCMMLSLLRNVPQVEERCRAGQTKDGLIGCELMGKTVGVVGTGAIGLRVAELCRAFGAAVIAYAPRPKEAAAGLVTYVPLEELLSKSDLVTLHCPLNSESRGLIGAREIALMKRTAYLVNTARGPVVDAAALADALNGGRIAGAAVDVFETEPPLGTGHPLLHSKNTIVTPHVAFATEESMEARARIVFDNLWSWMSGSQKNVILASAE